MAGCIVLHSVQPGAHLAMRGHTPGSPEAYRLMGDKVQPKRIPLKEALKTYPARRRLPGMVCRWSKLYGEDRAGSQILALSARATGQMWMICDLIHCCVFTKSHPTLCDPLDCSPPGSSVLGTSRARLLEWVAISFSGRYSQPRDQTRVSCFGRWILYH